MVLRDIYIILGIKRYVKKVINSTVGLYDDKKRYEDERQLDIENIASQIESTVTT